MRSMIWIVFLLFALAVQAAPTIQFNANAGKSHFSLSLPANPTTGYQWSVASYDRGLFALVKSEYYPPKSNLMGAGGQMLYSFVLYPGKSYPEKTTMVFKYARPWEKTGGSLQDVQINFIKAPSN